MSSFSSRIRIALLAAAAAAAVAGAVAVALVRPADPPWHIAFSLSDHTGTSVTERDFAGRHLLVFFGFTNCAMICPTQMGKLSAAMAKLDESGDGDAVTPLFVSVDPERDTPERMGQFLGSFDERFVGLTGARPALAAAARSFKAYLAEAAPAGIDDYQVVHATTVYIVGPRGHILDYVAGSEDADAVAARIRQAL